MECTSDKKVLRRHKVNSALNRSFYFIIFTLQFVKNMFYKFKLCIFNHFCYLYIFSYLNKCVVILYSSSNDRSYIYLSNKTFPEHVDIHNIIGKCEGFIHVIFFIYSTVYAVKIIINHIIRVLKNDVFILFEIPLKLRYR